MYIKFDKELKSVIKNVRKQVAGKFKTDYKNVAFVFCSSNNAGGDGMLDLCFQCEKGYANLELKDAHLELLEILKGFIKNKNVEWDREG